MIHKKKFKSNTKTIYYAYVQKLEVSDNTTEEEIDDLVFDHIFNENGEQPADYIWSEKPSLFSLFWED